MIDVKFSGSFQSYMYGVFPELNLKEIIFDILNEIEKKYEKKDLDVYIRDKYHDYEHLIKIKIKDGEKIFKKNIPISSLVRDYQKAIETI